MMKKTWMVLLLCLLAGSAKAQFEAGTKYVGASLTGLGLSYSSSESFRLGVGATAGYFLFNNVLALANVGYEHTKNTDDLHVGLSARYYFLENGIFMGAGAEYVHYTPSNNDVMIPVEIGYAYYLNHYLTIEPAVYYRMSLHDFADNSTVGFRLGFGFYF